MDGWWSMKVSPLMEMERERGAEVSQQKSEMIIGCKVMDTEREGERERERSGFISYMFIFPVAECPRSLISPLMGTPGRTQFRSEKHFLPKRWVMELLNCPITLNWSICAPRGIAIYIYPMFFHMTSYDVFFHTLRVNAVMISQDLCLTRSWRLIGPSISWKTLRFFRTRRKEKPCWHDRETVRWLDIEHRWIFPVRIGISVDINHQLEPGDLIIKHGVQSPLSNAMLVVSPGVSWQNPMLYSDRLFVGHWETRDFPHGAHPVGNHHFPYVL